MRIVYFGTPDFACIPLEKLAAAGHDVVLVVSMPDRPQGRKMKLTPSPVKAKALEMGIPCITPERLRDNRELMDEIKALEPDFFVVFAYGKIMRREFLDIPKYGCLNIHVSMLPKYRGAAPIQHAILAGDETAGITIMSMDEGMDTGDILLQTETEIGRKTAAEIAVEMANTGADMIIGNLERIAAGEIKAVPQPDDSPTEYAYQITKEMGEIDWRKRAFEIGRKVQAFNDAPVAWTRLGNTVLKIYEVEPTDEPSREKPGTVTEITKKTIKVASGDNNIYIKTLQAPGKKVLSAGDFLAGCKIEIGTILG